MIKNKTAKALISQGLALYYQGQAFKAYGYFCNHITKTHAPQWYRICMNMIESLRDINIPRYRTEKRGLNWFDQYKISGNKNKRRIAKILWNREGKKYIKPSRSSWTINEYLSK